MKNEEKNGNPDEKGELIWLSSALELRDWTPAASEMRKLLHFKVQYVEKKYSLSREALWLQNLIFNYRTQ